VSLFFTEALLSSAPYWDILFGNDDEAKTFAKVNNWAVRFKKKKKRKKEKKKKIFFRFWTGGNSCYDCADRGREGDRPQDRRHAQG